MMLLKMCMRVMKTIPIGVRHSLAVGIYHRTGRFHSQSRSSQMSVNCNSHCLSGQFSSTKRCQPLLHNIPIHIDHIGARVLHSCVSSSTSKQLKTKSTNPNASSRMISRILSNRKTPGNNNVKPTSKTEIDNAGWVIRLANENGYLSWCRNTYIATILGTSFLVQTTTLPHAGEVASIFIAMGGLNLASGTGVFMYNIVKLRTKMDMSMFTAFCNLFMAAVHVCLWCCGAAVCLGFASDAEELDELEENDLDDVD